MREGGKDTGPSSSKTSAAEQLEDDNVVLQACLGLLYQELAQRGALKTPIPWSSSEMEAAEEQESEDRTPTTPPAATVQRRQRPNAIRTETEEGLLETTPGEKSVALGETPSPNRRAARTCTLPAGSAWPEGPGTPAAPKTPSARRGAGSRLGMRDRAHTSPLRDRVQTESTTGLTPASSSARSEEQQLDYVRERLRGRSMSKGSLPFGLPSTKSQAAYASPEQTIIFFDWDDTVFPSTWLLGESGVNWRQPLSEQPEAPAASVEALARIATAARAVLCCSAEVGRTVVVTNARRPWVEDAIARFLAPYGMPQLDELGVELVYAAERLEAQKNRHHRAGGPGGVGRAVETAETQLTPEEAQYRLTAQKQVAMQEQVEKFYARYEGQSWKNIVSVGDAAYEKDAAQEVVFLHDQPETKRIRTKTIQLTPSPTPEELVEELEVLVASLPGVVALDDDLEVALDDADLCEFLEELLSPPTSPAHTSGADAGATGRSS